MAGSDVRVRVSLQSGVATGLAKIKAQFSEFRRGINGELGNLLAFGSVTSGIERLIEKGSQLQDISERFNVPVEDLQRVANVAEQSGGSLEGVAKSWNKMVVSQEKAIQGNVEARESFERLGIPVEEIAGMQPDQLFYRIANAVKDAKDRTEAYAAVYNLLGKSSGELFTTLALGSEEIKKQGDAMGVMGAKSVANLDRIDDAFKKLKNNLFVVVGSALTYVQKFGESLGVLAGVTVNNFERIFHVLGQGGGIIKSLLTGNFGEAKKLAGELAHDVAQDFKNGFGGVDVWKGLKDVWTDKLGQPVEVKAKGTIPEIEDTDAEKSKADKLEELQARLDEMKRKSVADQLEGEAKINELISQRKALLSQAAKEADPEKKLKLEIDAAEVGKSIDVAKKQRLKEIETAQDALEKATSQTKFASLKTDDERRAFLLEEIDRIQKLIEAEKDAAEKLRLQTDQQADLQKLNELDKKSGQAPTIAANQLRRIGGQEEGGFAVGVGGDRLLTEQKQHRELLKKIVENTSKEGGGKILMQ